MSCALINQDNLRLLEETIVLVNSLPAETYSHKPLTFNADSAGNHVRHVLDHYTLFLDGLATGEINYDLRKRDPRISSDPQAAIDKIREIAQQVAALNAEDMTRFLDVKMDTGNACAGVKTSVGRELQFLWSHHVHHNAIIRMVLEALGETLDHDFGTAASTQKYNQDQNQCAR